MALTQISTQGIKDGTITGADLATNVDLVDNQKIRLGNSQDLQIYHDGTFNYIAAPNNHEVHINANSGGSTENMAKFKPNGAVELYHDGTKKFETTSAGVSVTGNLDLPDNTSGNASLRLGNSQDFFMNHNGTDSFIINNTGNLYIRDLNGDVHIQGKDNEESIIAKADGAVELYFDNTLRFLTNSIGAQCQGDFSIPLDGEQLRIGASNDLRAYHDGTNSVISNNTGTLFIAGDIITLTNAATTEPYLKGIANGAVELYHNNSKKFETTSDGATLTGILTLGNELNMTEGVAATRSIDAFVGDAGTFRIRGTNSGDSGHQVLAEFRRNAGVHLNYSGSTKFETYAGGVQWSGAIKNPSDGTDQGIYFGVDNDFQLSHDGSNNNIKGIGNHFMRFWTGNTIRWNIANDGHFRPEANNAYDIGASNQRVRNIYTNDLNLSNEGGANDVDGTWGSYTIQEGAEDLFLVNKRSGKKYKFNLTEVS